MIGFRGAGMRPRLPLMIAAWCCLALVLAQVAGAVVLRDDLGRSVNVPTPPRRIVSLLPSLTETVCALGACDHLVAVGRFDDWPPAVRGLPRVGDLDHVSIERIVALRPDLVLLTLLIYVAYRYSSRIAEAIGATGTTIIVRLSAFLLFCIGIQVLWNGAAQLLGTLPLGSAGIS